MHLSKLRLGVVALAATLIMIALPAMALAADTPEDFDLPPGTPIPEPTAPGGPSPALPPGFIFLDMDSPATGSDLDTLPLVTLAGTITFVGEIFTSTGDSDMPPAGAAGDGLDIDNGTAELFFDFDVSAITFIYGGNIGVADFTARDIGGNPVDAFFQASTGNGQPVGPVTLSGSGIRSLYWQDPGLNYLVIDNVTIEPEELSPFLDIKPGSCPNSFNRNSNGLLPVAMVGDPAFDVGQVDLTTVQLERADGIGGSVQPNEGPPGPHSVFEDVATPFNGELCDCHELTGDGIDDLSMKFKSQQVVAALELNDLPPGALVELCVSGELLDGTEFEACDCIRVVPPGDMDGDGLVGVADLLRLLGEWGPCGLDGECSADYNGDDTVGVVDLLILLANWG